MCPFRETGNVGCHGHASKQERFCEMEYLSQKLRPFIFNFQGLNHRKYVLGALVFGFKERIQAYASLEVLFVY